MPRIYAGILGSTAFAISILRGVIGGGDATSVLRQAAVCLPAFAIVGAVVGRIALWTVEEGVAAGFRQAFDVKEKK